VPAEKLGLCATVHRVGQKKRVNHITDVCAYPLWEIKTGSTLFFKKEGRKSAKPKKKRLDPLFLRFVCE